MLFRRGSSVHNEAQRKALFAEILTQQHFAHTQARPKTMGERLEYWLDKLGLVHRLQMADGIFFNDLREPFVNADVAAVTLAATNKALYPASNFPVLGGQYFARPGKAVRVRAFGRITTAATPGNGQFAVFYGTGADANGTSLVTSAATALTASQTNLSWMCEVDVHCRTTGNAGTLFGTGYALFNSAVAATVWMIPASAPVASGSVDLTAANILSLQFNRSGSTAETMQVHNLQVIALN